jgi:hypothetical protein
LVGALSNLEGREEGCSSSSAVRSRMPSFSALPAAAVSSRMSSSLALPATVVSSRTSSSSALSAAAVSSRMSSSLALPARVVSSRTSSSSALPARVVSSRMSWSAALPARVVSSRMPSSSWAPETVVSSRTSAVPLRVGTSRISSFLMLLASAGRWSASSFSGSSATAVTSGMMTRCFFLDLHEAARLEFLHALVQKLAKFA